MMRSGRLLVEESPNNLLCSHGLDSLEDVFLKLCVKSESFDRSVTSKSAKTSLVCDDEKQLFKRLKCLNTLPKLTKVIYSNIY